MRGNKIQAGFVAAAVLALLTAVSLLGEKAQAAPAKNPGQNNIVISEFRSRGPNPGFEISDDFVEVFNPTAGSIDVSGWMIRSINASGSAVVTQFQFQPGTQLAPGQHYLVVGLNYSQTSMPADGTFANGGIPDTGGVVLELGDGTVVDKVGMSAASAEGTPLDALTGTLDQSYERLPGGAAGSCYDSNDNRTDFVYRSPSDPQNSNVTTALTVCSAATPGNTFTSTSTSTETPTGAITTSPTKTASSTRTGTRTNTYTSLYTFTPTAPAHLLISELRSRGPLGDTDEFVELFNPTGAATNIGNWILKYSSGCGATIGTLATIPDDTVLLAGQHYLLAASTGSSISGADQTFNPVIADDGGVALENADEQVVDRVGMCIATTFHEGENLAPLIGNANQSYERNPGGATACYDTNNNSGDFALISPAKPQNKSFPITLCEGVLTSTPTRTLLPSRTITRTRGPTGIPDLVVINEFLPQPVSDWNGDGQVNEEDEFIEIINRGTRPVSLANWSLDDGNSAHSYALPAVSLEIGQIMVFFHSQTGIALGDSGGTVRLIKSNAQAEDIFHYGPVQAADRTWCRLTDRNKGSLGFFCAPTPGKPNVPFAGDQTPTPEATETEPVFVCFLADTVPAAVVTAECRGFGTGIVDLASGQTIWLLPRGKWDVFLR